MEYTEAQVRGLMVRNGWSEGFVAGMLGLPAGADAVAALVRAVNGGTVGTVGAEAQAGGVVGGCMADESATPRVELGVGDPVFFEQGGGLVPPARRVRRWFLVGLKTGALRVGRALPGERVMAREAGVCRETVRSVLAELELAGMVSSAGPGRRRRVLRTEPDWPGEAGRRGAMPVGFRGAVATAGAMG